MEDKHFPDTVQLMTLLLNAESMCDCLLLKMKSNSTDDITT